MCIRFVTTRKYTLDSSIMNNPSLCEIIARNEVSFGAFVPLGNEVPASQTHNRSVELFIGTSWSMILREAFCGGSSISRMPLQQESIHIVCSHSLKLEVMTIQTSDSLTSFASHEMS